MAIRIDISPADRAVSARLNPSTCLLASAASRQWGGQWSFTRREIRSVIAGRERYYRHTAGSLLTMAAHDMGLPTRSYVRIKPTRMNHRERRAYRKAAAWGIIGLAAAGAFISLWIAIVAGVVIVALLAGKAVLGWQQHSADREDSTMPSLAELRAVPGRERQALLTPQTARAPAPASLPAPGPAAPAWPQAGRLHITSAGRPAPGPGTPPAGR